MGTRPRFRRRCTFATSKLITHNPNEKPPFLPASRTRCGAERQGRRTPRCTTHNHPSPSTHRRDVGDRQPFGLHPDREDLARQRPRIVHHREHQPQLLHCCLLLLHRSFLHQDQSREGMGNLVPQRKRVLRALRRLWLQPRPTAILCLRRKRQCRTEHFAQRVRKQPLNQRAAISPPVNRRALCS